MAKFNMKGKKDKLPLETTKTYEAIKDWVDLTLDPDTAFSKLDVSEGNKEVELTNVTQTSDMSSKRFHYLPQVLCEQGLTEKSYWEIEWVGLKGVGIAVSYDTIRRDTAGEECRFGCNPQSWRFQDGVQRNFLLSDMKIPIPSYNNIMGVQLNVRAGTMKFYDITPDLEEMILLYEAKLNVTAPLHPGFWLGEGTKLKISPKRHSKKSQRI